MEISKLNVISAETLFELDYNSDQVINDRRERGLSIDFFFYVRKSGYVVNMRDLHDAVDSIDICLEGGLNELGEIADTATEQQKQSVDRIVNELKAFFPTANEIVDDIAEPQPEPEKTETNEVATDSPEQL